jgi:hypothetical protein
MQGFHDRRAKSVQETQSVGASFILISPHTSPNEATTDRTKGIEFQSNAEDKPGILHPCQRYSTHSRRRRTTSLLCEATSRRGGNGYVSQRGPDSFLPQVLDPTRQISWRQSQD